ncbi:MAG: TIM-barrel domain-containing protein [Phycisphaerae bacterium]
MSSNRRDFLKAASVAAVAINGLVRSAQAAATVPLPGSVSGLGQNGDVLNVNIGTDVLRVQTPAPGILRLDLLADGKSDPHTPVLDPDAKFPGDPSAQFETSGDPIRVHADQFELRISRHPCRLTILDKSGRVLLDQGADQSLRVDSKNQANTGFSFRHSKSDNFYGIRNSGCFASDPFQYQVYPLPMLKAGAADHIQAYDAAAAAKVPGQTSNQSAGFVPSDRYEVKASLEGGGGAPFAWTTAGYGILVDSDGGYFQIKPDEIAFHYGHPTPEHYGRHYFRPNSLTIFILVGAPADIFRGLSLVSGRMPLFPKWGYGFTNSQYGINQGPLRRVLETYRADDIPIDNFTLDFQWHDWGASHYGEFRWSPVRFSQALYPKDNPDALINWTRELECKITGIMKPRIIVTNIQENHAPLTTQGAASKKLGLWFPGEKPSPEGELNNSWEHLTSIDLDFYKPLCRQWFWHATWAHQCMEQGIAGFWNDEADAPELGNFEFLHMQQAFYDGQRQNLSGKRIWSLNRNFYLGAQRYAYATWSGDILGGFKSMQLQTMHMLSTISLGQMRWTQDTGGFFGHPIPELYTRWFQFSAVCPILRTHSAGDPRQPWLFGDQACETVKLAIRQRYAWFFYTYALDHAACTQTGVGIVRPLLFDYPDDPHVAAMTDQWMFGDWILAAPVLEKLGTGKEESLLRRVYLPAGDWIDYFRGDRYKGGQWINYALHPETWMDWPLFIKDGAIIPSAIPVSAIHTAKPEVVYLDVFPAEMPSTGVFYDDDGESFDYEKGSFHRQVITAHRQGRKSRVVIAARQGTFTSSVKHYVIRLHGQAASDVHIGSQDLPRVADALTLSKAASGWYPDVDVYGPVTLVKVPAGAITDVVIEINGNQAVDKTMEVLTADDASLSGPTPQTRDVLATNHHGYTGTGFIGGFTVPGTAATFYLCRQQAGKYRVRFRLANGNPTNVQTLDVYVNGSLFGPLNIPGLPDWDTWEELEMYIPIVAGNNTVMIRHDPGNTGQVNLDCVIIPWQP